MDTKSTHRNKCWTIYRRHWKHSISKTDRLFCLEHGIKRWIKIAYSFCYITKWTLWEVTSWFFSKHKLAVATSRRLLLINSSWEAVRAFTQLIGISVRQLEEQINVWTKDESFILNFCLTAITITCFACSPVTFCSWHVVLKFSSNNVRLLLTSSTFLFKFYFVEFFSPCSLHQMHIGRVLYEGRQICKSFERRNNTVKTNKNITF